MAPNVETELALRRPFLDQARRVVVKVGSAVVTDERGLDLETIEALAADIAWLCDTGREVLLVSSGAVAAGRRRLGLSTGRALALREKQALAAVGQGRLMQAYETVFGRYRRHIAQILLTHDDLAHRGRYLNIRNTLFTLLHWGILPVVNENDTVSVDELRFGDNDTMAAMLTSLAEAELCVCLTDVDGLFTADPSMDPAAEPVLTVRKVDAAIEGMAGHVVGKLGTGGMQSKIRAAKAVCRRGGAFLIGPGRRPGTLRRLFAGEPVGTFFLPRRQRLPSRKHWIAYTLRPKGRLVLDGGACRALTERHTSLLPAGIVAVEGNFRVGAPVRCEDREGRPVAVGLVNYSAEEISRIKGRQTNEIADILGHKDADEVIHRDNLVVLAEA